MNPIYAKELRLLQPAWVMALALAVVPVWLLPRQPYNSPESVAVVPFMFGVVMLALSGFGREFGMQTFGLLLVQPLERRRIWRIKSGLLAAAMLSVGAAWFLSCWVCLNTVSRDFLASEAVIVGCAAAVVAFAGGLWTTLMLRQVAAAFWFTILVPGMIATLLHKHNAETWQVLSALAAYSAVGCWWARRQFLRAQETAWTGGAIALPSRRGARAVTAARRYRPLAALCRKELQLHQVALMGMAWLLLMHLGVVWLRHVNHQNFSDTVRTMLEVFGGIWIVVPLLAGSLSVSEERKLGTWAEQLSLPVSRKLQFATKLLFTLLIGGLLSAVLLCGVELIGHAIGGTGGLFGADPSRGAVAGLFVLFLAFALLGFYASTLAENVVQALAAAVVTGLVILASGAMGPRLGDLLLLPLWRGLLIYYFGWPMLTAAFCWLAWRNFGSASGTDHLWRRNAVVLGSVIAGILLLTFAVYHRAWELVTPAEPPPGPARIARDRPAVMCCMGSGLTAILPDGRLWVDRVSYDPGKPLLRFGPESGFRVRGKWTSLSGNQILPGSNWVRAVANSRETAAIRSDGTLWISEKPRHRRNPEVEQPEYQAPAALVQFGTDTNWLDVVQETYPWSVALLKSDGTLWRLGTNSFAEKNVWPGLRSFAPERLVAESGWDGILRGGGVLYAWKKDGSAWTLHPPNAGQKADENEMGVVLERAPFLDNTKWRGLARLMERQVGLREDGTLWAWEIGSRSPRTGSGPARMTRISPDSDWTAVAGEWVFLAARKADGSVWRWVFSGWQRSPFSEPPVRLGSRNDWVAVGSLWGGAVTLAADGSLYQWQSRGAFFLEGGSDQPMLAASRKPVLVENILSGESGRR